MTALSMSGIYEIVNTVNGKRYIGSAKNFTVRWQSHRNTLRRKIHANRYLQAAWDKYGEGSFVFRVIMLCDLGQLIAEEQSFINEGRPEYNLSPTAGSSLGVKFSEAAKRKISVALKGKTLGRKRDRTAVEKTAAAHRGMKRPKETGQKISIRLTGKTRDPEVVARAAAKLRGKIRSAEHVAHLTGNAFALGHRHSDEWKAATSARQKGRLCPKSPEHREKIAMALKGIPHSAERRAKQAAGQIGKKRGPYKKRIVEPPE